MDEDKGRKDFYTAVFDIEDTGNLSWSIGLGGTFTIKKHVLASDQIEAKSVAEAEYLSLQGEFGRVNVHYRVLTKDKDEGFRLQKSLDTKIETFPEDLKGRIPGEVSDGGC